MIWHIYVLQMMITMSLINIYQLTLLQNIFSYDEDFQNLLT